MSLSGELTLEHSQESSIKIKQKWAEQREEEKKQKRNEGRLKLMLASCCASVYRIRPDVYDGCVSVFERVSDRIC